MKNYILNNYVTSFANEVQNLIPVKEKDITLLKNLIVKYGCPNWAIYDYIKRNHLPDIIINETVKRLVDKVGIPITDLEKWSVFEDIRMDYRQWNEDEIIGRPGFGAWDDTLIDTISIQHGTLTCSHEGEHMCGYEEYALEYNNRYVVLSHNGFNEVVEKF